MWLFLNDFNFFAFFSSICPSFFFADANRIVLCLRAQSIVYSRHSKGKETVDEGQLTQTFHLCELSLSLRVEDQCCANWAIRSPWRKCCFFSARAVQIRGLQSADQDNSPGDPRWSPVFKRSSFIECSRRALLPYIGLLCFECRAAQKGEWTGGTVKIPYNDIDVLWVAYDGLLMAYGWHVVVSSIPVRSVTTPCDCSGSRRVLLQPILTLPFNLLILFAYDTQSGWIFCRISFLTFDFGFLSKHAVLFEALGDAFDRCVSVIGQSSKDEDLAVQVACFDSSVGWALELCRLRCRFESCCSCSIVFLTAYFSLCVRTVYAFKKLFTG